LSRLRIGSTNGVGKVVERVEGAFEANPAEIDLMIDGRLLRKAADQLISDHIEGAERPKGSVNNF
jgi:hypothetical protein